MNFLDCQFYDKKGEEILNISPEVQIAIITAVLILILVLIFRNRISEIVFGTAKLTLIKPEEMQQNIENGKQIAEDNIHKTPSPKLQWDKVATLFWLGNDLMWISDMIYRGALPGRVMSGILSARKYLLDLGFIENSFPVQQLDVAKTILLPFIGVTSVSSEIQIMLQSPYNTVVQYVESIKWYISALAEQQEPGFEKNRPL